VKRRKFIKLGSLAGVSTIIGMSGLKAVESFSESLANTERMPVLFLGHGSPLNAIEENQFVAGFRKVAKSIPLPKAIICISAHWFTKGTQVTAMEMPKTIHDFRGFPDELNNFQYPAPGNPDLAKEVKSIIQPIHADLDQDWGLDHGAWSVITHLYPNANIPVIQMSIDYTKPAQYHFKLAAQLNSLRDKGILIIGSGNIVHNLRMVDFNKMNQDD
jgi:4,5-DOPA dioxygenase extradiol